MTTKYQSTLARLDNLIRLALSTADGHALDGSRSTAAAMIRGARRLRRVRRRYIRRFGGNFCRCRRDGGGYPVGPWMRWTGHVNGQVSIVLPDGRTLGEDNETFRREFDVVPAI